MNIFDLDIEQDFYDSFLTGGGAVQECDCGREHVAITSEYFDYPEDIEVINDYRYRAETDSLLVLHEDCDYIGSIEIDGRVWADCCECKGWEKYMIFLVQNRVHIKDFLVRISERAQIALDQEKMFNILKDTEL